MAQEYQNVFACSRREDRGDTGRQVWFTLHKADRRETCFYFYLWDEDFGPAFIKICAYFPYPDQGMGQRARMGQAAVPQGRTRLHRTVQRIRYLRRPRCAAGDL